MTTAAATSEREGPRDEPRYLGHDLIFLISQPRSGSTLLQRMLAGHSWIQTSAETWLMLHPAYGLRHQGIQTDYRAGWAVGAVSEFLEFYADGRETWLDGTRAYARTIYGAALARGGRRRFLDKTPRYTMILPELVELFPKARFLILFRNPLAVLSSELRTYIRGDWPRLADFVPDLLEAPTRLVAARQLLAGHMLEVRYENLVQSPVAELQRICQYLDVPWEAGLDDYSDTPPPRGRANDPVGVHRHRRPSSDSLDTWRGLGRDQQTRTFALSYLDQLGDETVTGLGYDPAALRAAIEAETVCRKRRRVYPWSLAIKPARSWGFRERLASAYYFAAAERGMLSGVRAATTKALKMTKRVAMRLSGRQPKLKAPSRRSYGPYDDNG